MARLTRIGVLSSYFSGVHLGPIFAELIRIAPMHGCRIVALTPGEIWKQYQCTLSTDLCDAWLVPLETFSIEWGKRLVARGIPVCCLGHEKHVEGFSSVRSENALGITLAMEALFEEGHREFAFFGNLQASDICERRDAFLRFLADHNLPSEPGRVYDTKRYSRPGGSEAIEVFAKQGVRYTALIGGNDQVAIGALTQLQQQGIDVPGRVAIIGYDNIDPAAEPEIRLSSVDQNRPDQVAAALDELLLRLGDPNREPRHLRIPPRLVLRESSHTRGLTPEVQAVAEHSAELNRMYNLELSRLLNEAGNRMDAMLVNLGRNGRQVRFVVFQGRSFTGWFNPEYQGEAEEFGQDLIESTETNSDVIVIVPKEFSNRLDTALAVSIPRAHLIDYSLVSMAAREIEMTAASIDRVILQSRLESLVEERTRQLKETQAELLISAKTAAMVPIVRALAHRLNTPLGNSLLTLSMLKTRAESSEPAKSLSAGLDMVERNVKRIAEMVQGFQRICDLQTTVSSERFDVRDVVINAKTVFSAKFSSVQLAISTPDAECRVQGDRQGLDAALEAILENAAIHGGRNRPTVSVSITLTLRDQSAILTVTDDGPGMDAQQKAHAFDPFFTSQWSNANGLGLTLAHRIITTQLGGQINLASPSGAGLSVTIELPIDSPERTISR